jgi:succinyl-CoA synthetase beta subunit
MLMLEAEGKALLAGAGLPVPPGALLVQAGAALAGLPLAFPLAAKAQVRSGGRGKAGGVRRCDDLAAAEAAVAAILATPFGGELPAGVLLEPWLPIAREMYLSVVVDGRAGGFVALYAPEGGVEIESGPPPTRYEIGLPRDFRAHAFRRLLEPVEPDRALREKVIALTRRLLQLAAAQDCTTVEINPLIRLQDGSLVAGDAKVVRDDAAAFRHAALDEALAAERAREPDDVRRCQEASLMLVPLEGEVGLVSGGAGMTMAAMDAIAAAGGAPACFLDVSGNPTPAGFGLAFELLDRNPAVRAILVSMFGGGLHTDRVARTLVGILAARRPAAKPVVLRLQGTGSEAATEILAAAGHANHASLEAAVADAVARSRGAETRA